MITFDKNLARYVVTDDPDEEIKFTFKMVKDDKESSKKKETDVWKMMETISTYYQEEDFEDAFNAYCLEDAINAYTLEEFTDLFNAYEVKRKTIYIGDEVTWENEWEPDTNKKHRVGIVVYISKDHCTVLTCTDNYFHKDFVKEEKLTKTGTHFSEFCKEES